MGKVLKGPPPSRGQDKGPACNCVAGQYCFYIIFKDTDRSHEKA